MTRLGRMVMMSACFLVGCGGAGIGASPGPASAPPPVEVGAPVAAPSRADLAEAARRAVSDDAAVAGAAIAELRAAGAEGLDALLGTFPDEVARIGSARSARLERLRAAVERVARQRDAHASRLYWYTDLEEAKRLSRASGKPILSLRLLGNLDEELSCANSRFFRTVLYPNAEVSTRLREQFVLHWSSERPAPRVTIDLGDGRKLLRTITGNSIHYVLAADGRPIDALPGLYGPRAFLRGLDAARAAHVAAAGLELDAKRELLRGFHAGRRDALARSWDEELVRVGARPAGMPTALLASSSAPLASLAAATAPTKMMVEAPIVAAVVGPVTALPSPLESGAWAALLARHSDDARLDAPSRAVMRAKMGPVDGPTFARRLAAFEKVLAEDTVRNEYAMHRVLHEWMAMSPAPEDLETLNARVYASLFLTPRSDPWLGLASGAYSAIEGSP